MDDMRMDCMVRICKAYYDMPEHGTGGSLHIVLDDDNVDHGSVLSCIKFAEEEGDIIGQGIWLMLSRMTRADRSRLVSRYREYTLS